MTLCYSRTDIDYTCTCTDIDYTCTMTLCHDIARTMTRTRQAIASGRANVRRGRRLPVETTWLVEQLMPPGAPGEQSYTRATKPGPCPMAKTRPGLAGERGRAGVHC